MPVAIEAVTPPPVYTDEARNRVARFWQEFIWARSQKDKHHEEFDDMTYKENYVSNFKADIGYIPPKENDIDVRINSGIIPEKTNALHSFLIGMNFMPNVQAIDANKGVVVDELGEKFEMFLEKARLDEDPDYEFKRSLIYQEALRQGDAFVENIVQEKWEQRKTMKGGKRGFQGAEWNTKLVMAWRKLNTQLISGLNFFPGDIRTFWMSKQPYIFVKKVMPYSIAEQIFRDFPNWKSVSKDISEFGQADGDYDVDFHNWSIEPLRSNHVEVVQYQNVPDNEFAILVNGVLMTPVGYPLSELTGKIRYTVVKFSTNPISEHFFWSKSIPAKNKTDQEVMDEMKKLMVLKTQQSFSPPIGNMTGVHLPDSVFWPTQVVDNLNPDDIRPLIDARGVTPAEQAVYQILQEGINQKSISPVFSGDNITGNPTATQIVQQQKQSLQKLGVLLLGAIQFEKELAELMLDNIKYHWTNLNDPEFNTTMQSVIELETTLPSGQKGLKVVEFTDEDREQGQINAEAAVISQLRKKNVQKSTLSHTQLRKMDLLWKITIQPTERDSDALDNVVAKENYTFFAQAFPGMLNQRYWMSLLARKADVDEEQAFLDQSESPMGMMPPEGGQGISGQLAQATRPQPQKPSLNTLMRTP